MIVFIGDIHGEFVYLPQMLKHVPDDAFVCQVGDFGLWPSLRPLWDDVQKTLQRDIYFIDGNHDHHPYLYENLRADGTIVGWDRLRYIRRGEVRNIDGRTIGFCGGADSVDYRNRREGFDWFPEERVLWSDVYEIEGPVDLLVTHVPPRSTWPALTPKGKEWWGLPDDWEDKSMERIDWLWQDLGKPPLVCGHMHESAYIDTVRVLGINEVWEFPADG